VCSSDLITGGITDGDTLTTGLTFPVDTLKLINEEAPAYKLRLNTFGSAQNADRYLGFDINNQDRQISLSGDLTVSANATISGTNTGDQTITLTGDVTGSGTGTFAATIANDAVTYAKIQNVSAASRLLGRGASGGSGNTEEISIGSGLAISGTTLAVSGYNPFDQSLNTTDAVTFPSITLTDGIINSQTGALAYNFYDVVNSSAVPFIAVSLYDDQGTPALIGSSLFGFRGDGSGSGKQIFQGSANDFQFEGIGGANTATVSAATFSGSFTGSGANLTNLDAGDIATGTLGVPRGGTGATTLTANAVLLGNGTSAVQTVVPGTSGNVLTSDGTTWTSSDRPPTIQSQRILANNTQLLQTAVSGSGAAGTNGQGRSISTGATANSAARHAWNNGGINNNCYCFHNVTGVDFRAFPFARPVDVSWRIQITAWGASTNGRGRFYVGVPAQISTALANRGFGFEINASRQVQIVAHDGTTLTTSAVVATLSTSSLQFTLMRIRSDGAGNVSLYVDEVLAGTTTGGPTTSGTQNQCGIHAEVNNGADAATNTILTGDMTLSVY
jgi:hypothetical protein